MSPLQRPEPSPSEWKALRLVWERGPISARDVADALASTEGWAPSTVKTLLRRLVTKGHLKARDVDGTQHFVAVRSPKRTLFDAADELLGRAREDAVAPLLAHLVKKSSLTSDELSALRRLVEDEERRRSR